MADPPANAPEPHPGAALSPLAQKLLTGDPRALARALSVVESGGERASALIGEILPHTGRAIVVGFTGAPGAGKSTLIDAFVRELRARGRTVGILAVDPSSPITGGAILGDRIRFVSHVGDRGVFTRSLASRGHLGGLSRMAGGLVQVMDASGREIIVIETVGTGQSEVEIAEIADTKVVVSAPGLGDEIQAIKAGVLEIADVLVVNKSDLPLAPQTVRHLRAMLSLRHGTDRAVPLISTAALKGEGVAALVDAVEQHAAAQRRRSGVSQKRLERLLVETACGLVHDAVRSSRHPTVDEICRRMAAGEIAPEEAARRLLAFAASPDDAGPASGRGGDQA